MERQICEEEKNLGQIRTRRGKYVNKKESGGKLGLGSERKICEEKRICGQIRARRGKYVRKRICGQIRSGIREEGAGEEQSATWVLQWLSH